MSKKVKTNGGPLPDDLSFMQSPKEWPKWPLLPLKRRGPNSFLETGFLFADGKPVIYLGNIFPVLMGEKKEGETWADRLSGLKTLRFDSFEQIVNAGWEVD